VEVKTAAAFLAMREAAARDGVNLSLESGFRTRAEQRRLYRAYRRGKGNKAARPGRSNHQSGRALDISVLTPGARGWLAAHAGSFGFKRTVRKEPWHWEYVEIPRARAPHKQTARKKGKKSRSQEARRGKRRAARSSG